MRHWNLPPGLRQLISSPMLPLSLLLGPFAPWFILNGKKARRIQGYDGHARLSLLALLFALYAAALFLLPVHWLALLVMHLAASLASAATAIADRHRSFPKADGPAPDRGEKTSFGQAFLALSIAILPPVYFWALLRNLGALQVFSIQLPSAVYVEAFGRMLWFLPVAAVGAIWVRWTGFRFGLRQLVYLYAGLLAMLAWTALWEKIDQSALEALSAASREPVFLDFAAEMRLRRWVRIGFYGAGALLGAVYLMRSPATAVFLKRAFALGLPSLALFVNLQFYLGGWNHYLGGMGDWLKGEDRYLAYAGLAGIQLRRTPSAYLAPYWLADRMELDYQRGRTGRAREKLEELVARASRRPYYGKMAGWAQRMLRNWEASGDSSAAARGPVLDLPVVQQADYLDANWYGLLSAVGHLHDGEGDLELKTRLLDLSSTIHISLPRIESVPDLVPVLKQLSVPFTPAFLDSARLIRALETGHVPLLYYHGGWVPLCGHDARRGGFYFYDYSARKPRGSWFRRRDDDLFAPKADAEAREPAEVEAKLGLRRFVDAGELLRHLHDIGGVGLILGDSALATTGEAEAAYLVELGDIRYQRLEDYRRAAENYRHAYELHPNDYIASRLLFLRHLFTIRYRDPRLHTALFLEKDPPDWFELTRLDSLREAELVRRMRRGELGKHLLLNWYNSWPWPMTEERRAARLDTLIDIYTVLRSLEPHEPAHVDSLAEQCLRKEDYAAAESHLKALSGMRPGIHPHTSYRLAWAVFKQGRLEGLEDLLERCEAFSPEARHLAMQGALALAHRRLGKARGLLERSLKLDKTQPETHELLARCHLEAGRGGLAALHRRWLERLGKEVP